MTSSKDQDRMDRVGKLQQEVDDVTALMNQNIQKELEREGKLSDLDQRAEELNKVADVFVKAATRVHRKMWWETTMAKVVLALIIVGIVLIAVIVPLALKPV